MNVSDIREGGLPSKCSCRELDGATAKTPPLIVKVSYALVFWPLLHPWRSQKMV